MDRMAFDFYSTWSYDEGTSLAHRTLCIRRKMSRRYHALTTTWYHERSTRSISHSRTQGRRYEEKLPVISNLRQGVVITAQVFFQKRYTDAAFRPNQEKGDTVLMAQPTRYLVPFCGPRFGIAPTRCLARKKDVPIKNPWAVDRCSEPCNVNSSLFNSHLRPPRPSPASCWRRILVGVFSLLDPSTKHFPPPLSIAWNFTMM